MTIELYQFQLEDVEHIARQKAGLIGSEMGTGKTHVAIELIMRWKRQLAAEGVRLPALVIAPLNTFDSWAKKFAEQEPTQVVRVIDRKNRQPFINSIAKKEADVYLIHWDALRLVVDDFIDKKIVFSTVVADEVHRAANRKAQATRALKKIKCHRKLGMSGTASGDKPWNLWSILNWLWPSFYRSYWTFVKNYAVQELVHRGNAVYKEFIGVKNTSHLKAQMAPWYVRHLKRERCCEHHPEGVMGELPEKTYDTMWVDLSPKQRRIYDAMKNQMVAWVGEHEASPLVAGAVVAQMTRLSQMALATPEFDEDGRVTLTAPSSKIDAVKELINDHPEKQFVIFTSSKKAAYLAKSEFDKVGITSTVLSGDTPDVERRGMVDRFVDGQWRVFIGVIQAVAEGIDGLQYATDTAIFLDRSWSTIKNQQAEDRLHRGGQKDTVTIIDVMARKTLDFGRRQKLYRKWAWIKAILGDNAQEMVLKEEL